MKTLVGTPDKPSEKLGAKFYVVPSDHTPLAREHLDAMRMSDGQPFSILDEKARTLEFEQDKYGSFWREPQAPIDIPRDDDCLPKFFDQLILRQVTILKSDTFFHSKGEPMFQEGHYRLPDCSAICVITKMNHVCDMYCARALEGSTCQKYFWQVESSTARAAFDIRKAIKLHKLAPYRPLHI